MISNEYVEFIDISTRQVLSNQAQAQANQLEETLSIEQRLNAELSTANEELHALNEELHESQQQLAQLNFELEERVSILTNALNDSETMMCAAIISANLGTWFLNVQTRKYIPTERTKALFGFYAKRRRKNIRPVLPR
ncbi:MAG: hypothetical protein ACRYFL_08115 [Janthinobacterium lividum]